MLVYRETAISDIQQYLGGGPRPKFFKKSAKVGTISDSPATTWPVVYLL